MNPQIHQLYSIAKKTERLIIGLMSGTSLDGLDIALCKYHGSGQETKIELLYFTTVSYDSSFKEEVKAVFSKQQVSLEKVCLLNAWIGKIHARMILQCLTDWKIKSSDVDLIASHGQTIYHAPKSLHKQEQFGNATLQIGDGDHVAVDTGIITLSDFRQKHVAAGGEGAPLASYGDFLIFSKPGEDRIMLNIGGIANFTYLPGSVYADRVFSSDIGPGNTLMDVVIQKNFPGKFFDNNADVASTGEINEALLVALKDNPFFEQPFPKTTGPELFNFYYLEQAQHKSRTEYLTLPDVMATLNRFTADMIVNAIQSVVATNENVTIYSSGGGMHNPLLMKNIKNQLPHVGFKTTLDLGINPDAKEAVLFATLANECVCGGGVKYGSSKNGIPTVSMGKISFPG